MTGTASVSSLLQYFFAQHLSKHKHVTPRTIVSYRDTFRLLLQYLNRQTGRNPVDLTIEDLDSSAILAFLDYLESDRKNQTRSRNVRLCAIRSFFRVVALREPEYVVLADRVLAIPVKRTDKPLITYMTRDEVDALLRVPNQSTWLGRRDYALLLTMYNTGARASEMMGLVPAQLMLGPSPSVQIHGKGRKERVVPLWPTTAQVLRAWVKDCELTQTGPVFPTVRGAHLSADALDHLLRRAVAAASIECPTLKSKRITPHVIRHTTAMHLLQSGVDIAVIALWLGHESIETTHGYVEADIEMKERALSRLQPVKGRVGRFKPSDALLRFLSAL
jgi:site-specific recombinase XerD